MLENLENELWKLQGDVASGKHVPPGIRVLELAGNPAQLWFGKREEDVDRLRKENEALRALVSDGQGDHSATAAATQAGDGLVPRETLEVLQKEKAELEQTILNKEKRLLRLQQVGSFRDIITIFEFSLLIP